jgi:hypothetical protein
MVSSALPAPGAPLSFSFDQSFNVRVVMLDAEPWFFAADVCVALGIVNARDALAKLDDDEKRQVVDPGTVGLTDGTSVNNLVNVVNESGLYTLILRCRDATKPGTLPHRFRKWVTADPRAAPRSRRRHRGCRRARDGRPVGRSNSPSGSRHTATSNTSMSGAAPCTHPSCTHTRLPTLGASPR